LGKRLLEMALVSLGVAALIFGMGFVTRILLGMDIWEFQKSRYPPVNNAKY
jgi:hypothetical protein